MKSLKRKLVLAAAVIAAAVLAVPALGVAAPGAARYDVDIMSPTDQETVFSDSADLSVRTTVVPDLAMGDRLELLVDGTPAAPPSAMLEFPLYSISRGEHVLQARIVDSTGNLASTSPPSVIYIWQASLLFPNRNGRSPSIAIPNSPTFAPRQALR